MDNYRLRFLFRDERFLSCQVHIKDKCKTWIGVMAYIPDELPIWFVYNKRTGHKRHAKCLEALRWRLPVAYGRILMNLKIQFGGYLET